MGDGRGGCGAGRFIRQILRTIYSWKRARRKFTAARWRRFPPPVLPPRSLPSPRAHSYYLVFIYFLNRAQPILWRRLTFIGFGRLNPVKIYLDLTDKNVVGLVGWLLLPYEGPIWYEQRKSCSLNQKCGKGFVLCPLLRRSSTPCNISVHSTCLLSRLGVYRGLVCWCELEPGRRRPWFVR